MRGKPGNMLKLVRDYARTGRPVDHMSMIDEMPKRHRTPAASEQSAAMRVPEQPGAARGFKEGDRVMLARPFWGELDEGTGVLFKDWNGAAAGEPPSYRARSQGTIIYPHPAPEDFINEMRAKGNYIVMMDDGRKLFSCNSSPQPWVNADLRRIPGQCQVTYQNGRINVRPKFGKLDRVQLRESFICRNNGKRYEAGWRGQIDPRTTTLAECWDTGLYEVSLDDDPIRGVRGTVTVYAESLVLLRPGPDSF
jgi:hypothetical protein